MVEVSKFANFKTTERKENTDPSTCPVIVLADSMAMRFHIPEIKGGYFML